MQTADFDAVVIGAGFSGLYMVQRLRGLGLTVRVYEAADGVGGTWYWNRYPGCRCDVESVYYSYSFPPKLEQEWEWSRRYPEQPEVLAYLNHVADRFDLRRDIQLATRVTGASFGESGNRWNVHVEHGEGGGRDVSARYLNMFTMTGPGSPSVLSSMVLPIEQHADWIAERITDMARRDRPTIETTDEPEASCAAHQEGIVSATLLPQGNSWYMAPTCPARGGSSPVPRRRPAVPAGLRRRGRQGYQGVTFAA